MHEQPAIETPNGTMNRGYVLVQSALHSRAPSPQPSPGGRGRIDHSRSARLARLERLGFFDSSARRPARLEIATTCTTSSLSLGERVGVRGNFPLRLAHPSSLQQHTPYSHYDTDMRCRFN